MASLEAETKKLKAMCEEVDLIYGLGKDKEKTKEEERARESYAQTVMQMTLLSLI